MYKLLTCGLMAAATAVALSAMPARAQVVPDTLDPYELAPRNVHLYPVTLNARMPFYYVPPIFAPREMWRGALDSLELRQIAPHNYRVSEVPDSTALVAWGTVKKDGKKSGEGTLVFESANQQQFLFLPPENLDQGSSYMLVTTKMRFVPKEGANQLLAEFERELILEPNPRVESIAEQLPAAQLLTQFERVEDVADLQPRIHPVLLDELATQPWPVERIYGVYSGWRRDPNVLRTLGDLTPQWLTFEGKTIAIKRAHCGWFMLEVHLEGYNPWYPEEVSKNVMRKLIALSFNEFVEPTRYYDVERPLGFKEWHRLGSETPMQPYDTRLNVGGGSAGQGAY
jgi:hypothetical protein